MLARVRRPDSGCYVEFGKFDQEGDTCGVVYIPRTKAQNDNINLEQQMRLTFVVSSLLMLALQCPDQDSLWASLVLSFFLDISQWRFWGVFFHISVCLGRPYKVVSLEIEDV